MKFSITIPAFKQRFLNETIESCLAQTYTDFELIIVNDHSPEDIDSVVYSFNDPRIRYFVNDTNFGALNVVDNWNRCLQYSTGDYVICMGDDDKLLPSCLENYLLLISKFPNLDVYHTRTQIIDENSNVITLQEARPEFESVYSMIWHRNHGRIQYIGDFLFKSDSLKQRGGFSKFPMALSSDDISAVIAAKESGIANTETFGFQYRQSPETITNSGKIEWIVKGVALAKQWYLDFLQAEAFSEDDELMRILTLKDIDGYYNGMYRSLLYRDLRIDGRKAYKRWMRINSTEYHLPISVIKSEYIRYVKGIVKSII